VTDSSALIAATEALAAEPGIGRTRAARLYAMKVLDAAGTMLRDEIADEITAICTETVLEAVAAERERIAVLADAEAARGAKTGLDRISLRAFAQRLRKEAP
jgi:hypothetical protein